ncbi:hypothetical protein K491DRAFT_520268 [Lophiostoma macrostomum CBS 122681]|uniref:C2H2-type domain-containing protein n=1 Tax=Lophiostoma macrostomum CBS 122681 TaxID=1314788 RepID=A0A6A6T3D6_9PLEO|nr:hypothetical protein K491DRAFT_520268 [Lophiostoma macrostomum CBS 122681]
MKVHATLPIRTGAGAMKTPSAPHHTPELSRIQSRCNESSGSEESTDPEDDAELEDPWRTALKHLVSENKVLLLGTLLADVTFGRPEDSSFVCCGNSKDAAHTGARHQKESQNQSNKKQRTNAKDSKGTGDRKGHHDQGHDSDDDDMHDRSRKLVKKLGQGEPQNRFACPFFQRDSQCPWLNSSCHGPGFPTIHRLKEHLDRVHYIYQCDRCGEIFDTQPLLAAHRLVPALQICDVIDWAANFDRNNGFADTQKASIKQIKPNKSENPWHEIYGVLFPEDVESSYPPPYHNDTQFTQFLHRLQSHWTQHAPVVISQRLPNAGFLSRLATQEPQVIRAELVQLVNQIGMDIIRPFQHEIFRDRQDIEQGQRPVLPGCEHSHGFPTVARAMHGSATSEAQAGPSMDALALPSDYSTLNDNPPHPARALLDLFNDLAPTFNDDTSWALNLPFDDAVAGPSTIGVPHETRDSSNINPQQLALGPQQRTVFDGDRDDVVQSVEGDWDFVTG